MIKIYCYTKYLNDGASIPRVNSIKHLEETGYPCAVRVSNEIFECHVKWADIVVIHRPTEENLVVLARYVKKLGKKLWVDNDDDHLNVPIDHDLYLDYNREERKDWISECNQIADVVTISNKNILKSYGHLNKNIHFYPCSYDERIIPDPDFNPREKHILWRGSKTHHKSISEFSSSIKNIDKKFEGWQFTFIGDYPWKMAEAITNNKWWCDPRYMMNDQLWDYSRKIRPAIQMVCLTDNQFTKSRSNMAQLDATIAGAVTIARDWEHFKTPGVITYSDVEDFERILSNAMTHIEDGKDFRSDVENSWEYIKKNQTFKAVNVKQWEIVKSLCGGQL